MHRYLNSFFSLLKDEDSLTCRGSNNAGKLLIECNFIGSTVLRKKVFTFPTNPRVETISQKIL
jgi:hypothetical protein